MARCNFLPPSSSSNEIGQGSEVEVWMGIHWLCLCRYITQTKARPPSFVLFCNVKELDATYLRYLCSCLREEFNLNGVPVRIFVRASENPYTVQNGGILKNRITHQQQRQQQSEGVIHLTS